MTNCILSNILMFTAGAAIGSAVTYKFLKKKYERLAEEEIESIREFYKEKHDALNKETEENATEYETIIEEQGYTPVLGDETNKEVPSMGEPYIISPSEFGENDYETISLTYYADGILADEVDEIIDDVEDMVGNDFMNHFGEYEDDSVFVRNDRMGCDYEILLDSRSYSNVRKLYRPHSSEE